MAIKAYRNPVHNNEAISQVPLKKYRELARRIELEYLHSKRLTGEPSSPDQKIDELTKDWTTSERERFRYWFRNTRDAGSLTTAESEMAIRTAQYMPHSHQQVLEDFKNKRRSMIRRLRRLQNELYEVYDKTGRVIDWSDETYSSPEKKIEAIQNAINQICNLLATLRTKEVAAAALTRTVTHLKRIDAGVAKNVTAVLENEGGIVRVAAQNASYQLARQLKEELDSLNYGSHLRRFFHIYEGLHKVGLSGIANSIEEIIQKELGSLTGITKKLGEVYSELLKIPAEKEAVTEDDTEIEIEEGDEGEEVQSPNPLDTESFKTPTKPEAPNIPASNA